MKKALWIRLDIPYSDQATIMKVSLAYSDSEQPDETLLISNNEVKNIPEAVQKIVDLAAGAQINLDDSTSLVFPLDHRHALAGYVLDEAQKRNLKFTRHIPDLMKLNLGFETAYENFNTGSQEDTLDSGDAQNLVLQLNDDAHENYSSGDLSEGMGIMRHALWLSLRHYGWVHPATAYSLRNFGYTMQATGNQENSTEAIALCLKLLFKMDNNPPDAHLWKGSESLLEELGDMCAHLGETEIGAVFKDYADQLK